MSALKAQHQDAALGRESDEALHAELLRQACLSYGDDDWPSKWRRAERIRVQRPALATRSLHAAVVCGEREHVRALLEKEPALVAQRGGPQQWEPLLFACYGRLPNARSADSSLEIARLLLDHGADPNACFVMGDGDYRFTALTGALGQGELGQPPHAHAQALAQLLLERGASAHDAQALYNTHLVGDDTHWLELLARHGLDASKSCHHTALLAGHRGLAALLLERGATQRPLEGRDAFLAACMRGDRVEAERLLDGRRDYLAAVEPLIRSAQAGELARCALLLELGMEANGLGKHGMRPLHASWKQPALVELMLQHGADVRARCHGGTLSGWARSGSDRELARRYAELSGTLLDAVSSGHVTLAERLLAEQPACLAERSPTGGAALHALPDDAALAEPLIALLLQHGADESAVDDAGRTPAQALVERGLDPIADLLDAAVGVDA